MDTERLIGLLGLAISLSNERSAGVRQCAEAMAAEIEALLDAATALTTAEAAARLGVSPYAVRKLVARKRLTARREGRELRITRESVEAFAVDRRPRRKAVSRG